MRYETLDEYNDRINLCYGLPSVIVFMIPIIGTIFGIAEIISYFRNRKKIKV